MKEKNWADTPSYGDARLQTKFHDINSDNNDLLNHLIGLSFFETPILVMAEDRNSPTLDLGDQQIADYLDSNETESSRNITFLNILLAGNILINYHYMNNFLLRTAN